MDYLKGADLRYHICYHQNFTEAQTSISIINIFRVYYRLPDPGLGIPAWGRGHPQGYQTREPGS